MSCKDNPAATVGRTHDGKVVAEIRLAGCDDSTTFRVELTDDERDLIERMSYASLDASAFDCQPRMTFTLLSAKDLIVEVPF